MPATTATPRRPQLKPFSKLTRFNQLHIEANRLNHPGNEEELRWQLRCLELPELAEYLVWIPYERFVDVSFLGRGGFSTVYKGRLEAVDPRGFAVLEHAEVGWKIGYGGEMSNEFALKEFDPQQTHELVLSTYLAFCGVNATMGLIGLSNRNGKYLMVMDYAEEGSLEKRSLDQPPPTHWREIIDIARDIADRIYLLHKYGLMHNDLHAGNVVFRTKTYAAGEGLFARLIDVGLSTAVGSRQDDGGVYGRMAYLPPEMFIGKTYTTKSDVYCFGILLWQLVVGVPPDGTAVTVREEDDVMREEMVPGAPDAFTKLLRNCWDREPEKRPKMVDVVWRLYTIGDLPPMANETKKWIERRKEKYKEDLTSFKEEGFEFCEAMNSDLHSSKFHLYKTLKAMPENLKPKKEELPPVVIDNRYSILAPEDTLSPTTPTPTDSTDRTAPLTQPTTKSTKPPPKLTNAKTSPGTPMTTKSTTQPAVPKTTKSNNPPSHASAKFLGPHPSISRTPLTATESLHGLRLVYARGVPTTLDYQDLRQCLFEQQVVLRRVADVALVGRSVAEFCVEEGYVHGLAHKLDEFGFEVLTSYVEACPRDGEKRMEFFVRWNKAIRRAKAAKIRKFAKDLVAELEVGVGSPRAPVEKVEGPSESMLADENVFPALGIRDGKKK